MDYFDWNFAISRHFFNGDMAGSAVYLNVSEALINELGAPFSKTLEDFISALKIGPPGLSGQGRPGYVCDKALKILLDWRTKDFVYPPYIAYLALFVLATNKDGDYSARAYHPRLRQLLDPADSSRAFFPSFEKTYELWSDLEHWANRDQQGQLGVFNADIVGNHFHIGLPRGQVLLTDIELRKLPEFFVAAGLTNDSSPSDQELLALLMRHGGNSLREQTRSLLQYDTQAQEIISKIVSDKLWEWDNTAVGDAGQRTFGSLFLSLESIDEFAGIVTPRIHAKSRQGLPEEGCRFTVDDGQVYAVSGSGNWSNALTIAATKEAALGSSFAWDRNLRLADDSGVWSFSWVGSPVRIFVNGSTFGVNGMAEIKQIPAETPFWLAVDRSSSRDIIDWASQSCEGFRQLNVQTGLPPGWSLYSLTKAVDDSAIKNKYPMLAMPVGARFHLLGGIAVRGSRYFAFAPPTVAVTYDNSESFEIICDGQVLSGYCKEGKTYFEIPPGSAVDCYLTLELRVKGQVTQTRYLYLDTQCEVPPGGERFRADRSGQLSSAGSWLSGTHVDCLVPPCPFAFFGMEKIPRRLYLLGNNPGEICSYAQAGYPSEWEPTWWMINGRRIKIGPCTYVARTSTTNCAPKSRRHWHEVLWHRRRRTSFKTNDTKLVARWNAMRKIAHDARR